MRVWRKKADPTAGVMRGARPTGEEGGARGAAVRPHSLGYPVGDASQSRRFHRGPPPFLESRLRARAEPRLEVPREIGGDHVRGLPVVDDQ